MFDRDWSRQIEAILTTDGTKCGIQAADLLAWIQPRYDGLRRLDHPPASERQMMMSLSLCAHLSAHPTGIVYDYDRIVAAYQRRQSK